MIILQMVYVVMFVGSYIDGKEPGYQRTCDSCKNDTWGKIDKIERNKQRSDYAIEEFKKNEIKYVLKNSKIGHFHIWRKKDNQLFQFWAGTGKITGPIPRKYKETRGIKNLIKILLDKGEDDGINNK